MPTDHITTNNEVLRARLRQAVIGCGVGWMVLAIFSWLSLGPWPGFTLATHALLTFAFPNRSMLKVSIFGFSFIFMMELLLAIDGLDTQKTIVFAAMGYGIFSLYRLLMESRVLLNSVLTPADDAFAWDQTPLPEEGARTQPDDDQTKNGLPGEAAGEVPETPVEDPMDALRWKLNKITKEYGILWLCGAAGILLYRNELLPAVVWSIMGLLHIVFPSRTILLVSVLGYGLLGLNNMLVALETTSIQDLAVTVFLGGLAFRAALQHRSFAPLVAPHDSSSDQHRHPISGWISLALSLGSIGWVLLLLIIILVQNWWLERNVLSEPLPVYYFYLFLASPFCALLGTLVSVHAIFQRRRRRILGVLGGSIGLAVSLVYLSLYFNLAALPAPQAPITIPMVSNPEPPQSDL